MPEDKNYDIVIIGGGIQGAGVAQAAAGCGYKTLLIEQFPEAGMGTSSKSSKLIHGGLRYLESGQFKLVKECLQERKTLLNIAPHLVKLLPFHIPVYADNKRPGWLIWIGLFIYSILSLKKFTRVRKKNWKDLDGIKTDSLKHVFKYYDAQTDDKKLTEAVIASAIKYGATIEFNSKFISSSHQDNTHHIKYNRNSELHYITCKCIINCSGPWIDAVQKKISAELKTPEIELVAGTHIIINRSLSQGAFYLETQDQRAVFVIPWKENQTLIGTTEKTHNDSADSVAPTTEEIEYLISTYNRYFNNSISQQDVAGSFSGLRVLPKSKKDAFHRSRESLIVTRNTEPFLITLIGGKLTSYRSNAEQVISKVNKLLPEQHQNKFNTRDIKLNTN